MCMLKIAQDGSALQCHAVVSQKLCLTHGDAGSSCARTRSGACQRRRSLGRKQTVTVVIARTVLITAVAECPKQVLTGLMSTPPHGRYV
jgi:hypothetical protein